ncbi:dTDP-4-dehydrorhamnose 3,5-epimerase [Campylobacter sp. US25a]|uniref:dTDP-4-dehydrorhamnose 3,5-epimerase n=1 Tax=Campylobacter sp. US25a TaxID=2498119 RepID=UPI001068A6FA|nr:dTDP-4-dehydrorhamnose 3,5-epimerase [Campylobacter sp. US25a]TEY07364.1 dTDP-4-dehydrorhamnose 3,5-epimerase [Campylobacter sp. US25a]
MSRFNFIKTHIDGVFIVEAKPIYDERGYFERYFCVEEFKKIGLNKPIVQINHSKTIGKGSIRGLHYQTPPFCETKIVRCLKGAIFDVAVDLRENSPTFLQYVGVELNEENAKYLYIPQGFAHGFQTLSDEVEILYLVTKEFNSSADNGINPFDEKINIKWHMPIGCISIKDQNLSKIDLLFKGIKL